MPLLSSAPTSDNHTMHPTKSATWRGPRPSAHGADEEGRGCSSRTVKAQSSVNYNYKLVPTAPPRAREEAASIPMPNMRPAADGRRGQARMTCRRPPHHDACENPFSHARDDGHLVTTSRCPRNMRRGPGPKGRRRADGVPGFGRPGQARATTAAPPPSGKRGLVGLGRLERPTSRLSGVRSNQLSYRPERHPAGPRQRAAGQGEPMTSHPRTSGPTVVCEGTCRRRRAISTPGDDRTSPHGPGMPRACPRRWGPREVVQPRQRPQSRRHRLHGVPLERR